MDIFGKPFPERVLTGRLGESTVWERLNWTGLHAEFEALDHFSELPAFKGSTFRGALGHPLVRQGCWHGEAGCGEDVCERPHACVKGSLWMEMRGPRGSLPQAYLVVAPPDPRRRFRAGDVLTMGVRLVGDARPWVPWVERALASIDTFGQLNAGRWRVRKLWAEDGNQTEHLLLDAGRMVLPRVLPVVQAMDVVGRLPWRTDVVLRFLAPVDVKIEGRQDIPPSGTDLLWLLVGRVHDLVTLYGGEADPVDLKPFKALAQQVRTAKSALEQQNTRRLSSRASGAHPLRGWMGELVLGGIPAELWPFLVLGQFVHVGRNPSMGLGRYQVLPP